MPQLLDDQLLQEKELVRSLDELWQIAEALGVWTSVPGDSPEGCFQYDTTLSGVTRVKAYGSDRPSEHLMASYIANKLAAITRRLTGHWSVERARMKCPLKRKKGLSND